MLSLAKSTDNEEIKKFIGEQPVVFMLKCDGLTCSLLYKKGKLVRAETRGDGFIGEDVTENIKMVSNVPLTISEQDEIVVDGEMNQVGLMKLLRACGIHYQIMQQEKAS